MGPRPWPTCLRRFSRPSIPKHLPSRTSSALGPPGQHGMLGYKVLVPGENILLNALRWDSRVDPRQWQALPTIYERATEAGIAAVHVAQGAFRRPGLTRPPMP